MKSLKHFSSRNTRPLKVTELHDVYQRLLAAFGHQHWWPGETPFEVMIGAILTQNTAWTNVEKAIGNLKAAGCLSPEGLRKLSQHELAQRIRPSGYFNIKAQRLKCFIEFLFAEYGGDLNRMFQEEGSVLREKLLQVKGIGPETADSILLYAAQKPFFVIDAYTKRIFERHGLKAKGYEGWQTLFMKALASQPALTKKKALRLYNDFHAQIVHLGKHFCKSQYAFCDSCPLAGYL